MKFKVPSHKFRVGDEIVQKHLLNDSNNYNCIITEVHNKHIVVVFNDGSGGIRENDILGRYVYSPRHQKIIQFNNEIKEIIDETN